MNLDELQMADEIGRTWFRRIGLVLFVGYAAFIVAGTVFALFPPHLSGWAQLISARSVAHAARHGGGRVPWQPEEILLMLRAGVAAAWSSVVVLGIGLGYGLRGSRFRVKLA